MKYYDFTLILERSDEGRWNLRVESENQGESGKIELDVPTTEWITDVSRRLELRETDRNYLESLGLDLFGRLMVDRARDMFHLSLGEVNNDSTRGLRLRFRAADPEIAVLPWELLYTDVEKAFLGTRIKTPIVRYIDLPLPRTRLATPYPIRILVVIPRGDETTAIIDTKAERKVIDQATSRLKDKVEVTYLGDQFDDGRITWLRLVEHLAEKNYQCLHYIGHGSFQNDRGNILLDGEDGAAEFVDQETFAAGLTNAVELKLVVLNACNTASQSSSKPLAGVAVQLVKAGVPAVLAMQFSILDTAAVVFARVFYHSLFVSSNRGRVDVAASRGRQALGAKFSGQRELAAPVLFTHAKTNVLLVPEAENAVANVPLKGDRLDVLEEARDSTPDPGEKARFSNQIRMGRGAVRAALLIGIIVFLMSAVRFLDIFGLDTEVEMSVMALGNQYTEHRLSDELRVVTIDVRNLSSTALREQVGQLIVLLNRLGAKTIALDLFYRSSNGEFAREPESGLQLVTKISESAVPVVVSATSLTEGRLDTPAALRRVVTSIGFACTEKKKGLARSLPISAEVADAVYPSFALAAFGVHRDAAVFGGFEEDNANPYLVFPNKPSEHLDVSEFNWITPGSRNCEVFDAGGEVAHRFVTRTPDSMLSNITSSISELQSMAEENVFAGKLVVVGVIEGGDIVSDHSGQRDGVFWQADAINNLLLNQVIKPVHDFYQLTAMLFTVFIAMLITLKFRTRKLALWAAMVALWVLTVFASVALYARFGLVLNPAYFILATMVAWLLARQFGQRWIVK